jgi:hypothetical protein
MTTSRIVGILALFASIATTAAAVLDTINPKWAAVAASTGAVVAAATERIQGGASSPAKVAKTRAKQAKRLPPSAR